MGRGASVLFRGRRCHLLREVRREALVEGDDLDAARHGQLLDEGLRLTRLLPQLPRRVSGMPTTTRSTPCSRISSTIRATLPPSTTPIGRAIVPVGSETATPVRARP